MPKLLITGAEGQLGYEIVARAQEEGFEVVSCNAADLDITDLNAVSAEVIRHRPAFVVNAAGRTPNMLLETRSDYAVNSKGAAVLAAVCSEQNIALIQLSCAYVFDGKSETPYPEDAEAQPATDYGKSLAEAEQQVREQCKRHIILRTGWVFSIRGQSVVRQLIEQARTQRQICVSDGRFGTPTSAADISRVVTAIIKQFDCGVDNWGTYHYTASEPVSWFDFCETVVAAARQYGDLMLEELVLVHESESGCFGYPANSVLNCEKILRNFGVHQRSWRTGLMSVSRTLYGGAEEGSIC